MDAVDAAALAALTRHLHRAMAGAGLAVAVVGEPGIGKTRLLDDVAKLAAAKGALLLRGAPLDPDGEPRTVLTALHGGSATDGPRVVLLDDLQWADADTAASIDNLLDTGVPRHTLLVLADRRRGAPWATGHRIEIRPCPDEVAAPRLAGFAPGDRTEALRLCGGNPFYLGQLTSHGVPQWLGDPVPPAVAEAVYAEVEMLTSAEQTLLRGAAVVGDVVEPVAVAAAAGLPGPVCLDALVASGLLRRDADGMVRFRRPLVRWAVYAGAGPGWRLAAHCRVAAVLAGRGASARERAVHVERCARSGDDGAARVLVAAAESALGQAPAEAARWYAGALRVLPADASPQRRVALAAGVAVANGLTGRLGPARATLRSLAELPASAVAFDVTAGWLLGRQGSDRPLSAAAPASPTGRAELAVAHAEHAMVIGDPALPDLVVTARLAARVAADQALGALADVLTGLAEYRHGRIEAASMVAVEASALVDGLGEDEIGTRLPVLFWLSRLCLLTERCADAERHARRGAELVLRTGQGYLAVAFGCALAAALSRPGRLTEAADVAEQAQATARRGGNPHDLAWALATRAEIAVAAGDLRAALAWGNAAAAIVTGLDRGPVTAALALHLAHARWEAGDVPASEIVAAAGGADLADVERPDRAGIYELLTRAAVAADDVAAAQEWALRAETVVLALPLGGRVAAALRARAVVDLAAGRAQPAATAATQARLAAESAGLLVDAGRARILAGRAWALAGDPVAAVTELRAAHGLLSDCGARRAADEAAQLLRGLGQRPTATRCHRSTARAAGSGGGRSSVGGLSRRERDVAELVADGLTNREIAARLFVSDKTVEAHLAATFRKLGVHNRSAVAAAVR